MAGTKEVSVPPVKSALLIRALAELEDVVSLSLQTGLRKSRQVTSSPLRSRRAMPAEGNRPSFAARSGRSEEHRVPLPLGNELAGFGKALDRGSGQAADLGRLVNGDAVEVAFRQLLHAKPPTNGCEVTVERIPRSQPGATTQVGLSG